MHYLQEDPTNTTISWECLEEVQERDRAIQIPGEENGPWAQLFDMGWPAHRELIVEFYCTLWFRSHDQDAPELDKDAIEAGDVPMEVTFSIAKTSTTGLNSSSCYSVHTSQTVISAALELLLNNIQ
ncbi:hypothetical protein QVD17_00135 [Tagetes erecta]|uniref:Uncharacterized protein n=1 Tax=Tagetes erecta TaxID=13708 RepID=A0AAD8LB13_TARER|nr:hypothetical protein QVD17_00135 [Tagetes erecta]